MAFIPLHVVVAREEALQERARLAVGAVQAQAQTVASYAQGHDRAEISEAHDQQRAQIHTLEAQAQAYAHSMGLDAYQGVVRTEEIAYQEVSALMVQTTRQSEQVQSVEAAARAEIAALRGAATKELHATRAGFGTEMAKYRKQVQDEWQAATGRHRRECDSLRTVAESYHKDAMMPLTVRPTWKPP